MKILVLGSKEYPAHFRSEACGGIEVHVEAVVKSLLKKGLEVFLVTRLLPNGKMMEHKGALHIYRVPSLHRRLFRTFTFNLSSFFLSIFLIARHDLQLIHANDFTSGFFGALLKLLLKRPFLLSAPTFGSKQVEWPSFVRPILLAFERFSLTTSDFVFLFVPSDIDYVSLRYGVSPTKVRFLGNGVDITRFNRVRAADSSKGKIGLSKDAKVVIFVGRLTRSKGLEYLIRAFRKIAEETNSVLLIVGDGAEKTNLQRLVQEIKLQGHVVFLGRRLNVENLLKMADAFALPSVYEGFPISLIEAMASRKPIVATKVGAIPFVIEDGVDGLLVEPGNVDQLSQAILRILSNDELHERLSDAAYRKVRERYSWEKISDEIYSAYRRLIGDARSVSKNS